MDSKNKLSGSGKERRGFTVPHVFVILIGLVFLAAMLTYLIPAGAYERVIDDVTGNKVVDPASFHLVARNPISFLKIPEYVFNAIVKAASTVFLVIISTASIEVFLATGAFDVALRKFILKFNGRENVLLLAVMFIFALMGINMNAMNLVGYIPLVVLLCRMCGYDAICASALVILGAGGTFSCGMASLSITGVAQELSGLPKFSGFGYRALSAVVIFTISACYLQRYAKKIKKDPTKSIVYELEQEARQSIKGKTVESSEGISMGQWGVLLAFICYMAGMIIGCLGFGWSNPQVGGYAMFMAVVGGLIGGYDLNWISKKFANGASKTVTTGLMIGIAGAISSVMTDGMIVDTVIYGIASIFSIFPNIFQPALLYIINSVVNVFITSGSGQAAVVIPILAPLSDIVGITRQTCVLAFNFGDGFSNFLIPTSAALMGNIAAAGVTLPQWLKFFIKLFLLWSLAAMILVTVASVIQLGPF